MHDCGDARPSRGMTTKGSQAGRAPMGAFGADAAIAKEGCMCFVFARAGLHELWTVFGGVCSPALIGQLAEERVVESSPPVRFSAHTHSRAHSS